MDLRERIEIVHTSEYANFLAKLFPAFKVHPAVRLGLGGPAMRLALWTLGAIFPARATHPTGDLVYSCHAMPSRADPDPDTIRRPHDSHTTFDTLTVRAPPRVARLGRRSVTPEPTAGPDPDLVPRR